MTEHNSASAAYSRTEHFPPMMGRVLRYGMENCAAEDLDTLAAELLAFTTVSEFPLHSSVPPLPTVAELARSLHPAPSPADEPTPQPEGEAPTFGRAAGAYILPADTSNRYVQLMNEAFTKAVRESWPKFARVLTTFPAPQPPEREWTPVVGELAVVPMTGCTETGRILRVEGDQSQVNFPSGYAGWFRSSDLRPAPSPADEPTKEA